MDVEKIVREYIDKTIHMSLASCKDNTPWVCEVHFAYDQDLNLYFRSLSTRRHSLEIAENPRVAGDIIKQHEMGEGAVGVYFEGTAKRLEAGEEQNKAFKNLKARLGVADEALNEAAHEDGHQFYKITVDNWYVFGRFDTPKGQKYKLVWHGDQR
jgi:uncharacterized protein YhbP (UPF0306 family)